MKQKLPKLDLNITNRCNFRCAHCAFDSGVCHMDESSVEKIEEILRETKTIGGERIDITGGEATMRTDLDDIIHVAKQQGYRIELVTNGSRLTKKRLQELKDIGMDTIAISVDGSSYDIFRKIRPVSEKTYHRVMQTVEESIVLGIPTKVNTVVCNANLADIATITRYCIDAGAYEHGIYYYTPVGRGERCMGQGAVEPLEWLSYIRTELVNLDSQIKISLEVPLIEKEFLHGDIGCIANTDQYHYQILPDGNVYPCAILASYHKPIANLHESSVTNLWQNAPLWNQYWDEIAFPHGHCVDFSSFDLNAYDKEKYKCVCPLRKFGVKEVVGND